jgi:hypothetical protein
MVWGFPFPFFESVPSEQMNRIVENVSDYVTHRKTADEMFEHYFCRVPH